MPMRWQEHGLSISCRACSLSSLESLEPALQAANAQPQDVHHLDLAENALDECGSLSAFTQLRSLDLSHNNVEAISRALPNEHLLHLNVSYNRLEHADGIGALSRLVELNLGYNVLSSLEPLAPLTALQMLLLAGNRIATLHGLARMASLEMLDLSHNYVAKLHDVRLLSLNARLRTLSLNGNPVAKLAGYRAAVVAQLPAVHTLDGGRTPRSPALRQCSLQRGAIACKYSAAKPSSSLYHRPSAATTGLALVSSSSGTALKPVSSAFATPHGRVASPQANGENGNQQTNTQKKQTCSAGAVTTTITAGNANAGANAMVAVAPPRTLDERLRRSPAASTLRFAAAPAPPTDATSARTHMRTHARIHTHAHTPAHARDNREAGAANAPSNGGCGGGGGGRGSVGLGGPDSHFDRPKPFTPSRTVKSPVDSAGGATATGARARLESRFPQSEQLQPQPDLVSLLADAMWSKQTLLQQLQLAPSPAPAPPEAQPMATHDVGTRAQLFASAPSSQKALAGCCPQPGEQRPPVHRSEPSSSGACNGASDAGVVETGEPSESGRGGALSSGISDCLHGPGEARSGDGGGVNGAADGGGGNGSDSNHHLSSYEIGGAGCVDGECFFGFERVGSARDGVGGVESTCAGACAVACPGACALRRSASAESHRVFTARSASRSAANGGRPQLDAVKSRAAARTGANVRLEAVAQLAAQVRPKAGAFSTAEGPQTLLGTLLELCR